MRAYYNEVDLFCAQWLRNLIAAGHIAPGDVDERPIQEVHPFDLIGYRQCHFFAGIGVWSYALRLAGWEDDREVWTGSCPCQPFSSAGARKGFADDRHLWPHWRPLIAERRPATVFGEQVARAADWLALVRGDLEAMGYALGAMPIEAASVGARHRRDRLWFAAHALSESGGEGRIGALPLGQEAGFKRRDSAVADPDRGRRATRERDVSGARHGNTAAASRGVQPTGNPHVSGLAFREGQSRDTCAQFTATERADWWAIEPGMGRVANGVAGRVGKLRAYGNAIVPQVAAEFIGAFMECAP